jgi:GMP synthase PP-ATPase subunit
MVQSITYQSETKTVHFQGKSIVLESLTPVLSPKEKRKKEIERCLYEVFSKYRKASNTPA